MSFEKSIFINCPFDDKYLPLLKSLLFATIYLGFTPRIATERLDSAEMRIDKLIELIRESKFGIHDLSRLKSNKKGEYFRLNMPFELGIDIGCKTFGDKNHNTKKCLILEKERFRYQAALSDLSGADIKVHHDSEETLIKEVRNWLTDVATIQKPPSPSAVWSAFIDYNSWLYDNLTPQEYTKKDIIDLPVNEIIIYMTQWLALPTNKDRSWLASL